MVRFASCESDCPVLLGGAGLLRQYIPVLLRNRGDPSPRPFGLFPPRLRCSAPRTAPVCARTRASLHCVAAIVRFLRNLAQERKSASGCFCGRMPPKWGPCGAARGRRKSPKGGAQDARQFVARTRMCAQRTPEHPRGLAGQDARRARYLGCVSFGYLSLHKQRKVTRSPAGRVKALHFKKESKWIPACAGMTAEREGAGLYATPVACPSGHSLRECSLRHPASAVRLAPE